MAGSDRLTRDDWIALARKSLIGSGIDDVKVDLLARRLKVTRGSFYWHFTDRQELLDALLADWEANNRREVRAIANRLENTESSLTELFKVWLGEDPAYPAFDIAIRAWARKSKQVAQVVGEIDQLWLSILQDMLQRTGMKPPESLVRARIMYFHQVGYFALSLNETVAERAVLAPYYYAALSGSPAPDGFTEAMLELGQPKKRSRTSKAETQQVRSDKAAPPKSKSIKAQK